MTEITTYHYRIEPQDVDFTLRASASSIINYMLNVAGIDAHNKGFGVDALLGQSVTWVLSRFAVDIALQPAQYEEVGIDTWVNDFNRLSSTRNFVMHNAQGVVASGVSQWCMFDIEKRQSVDMSMLKDVYLKAMVDQPSPIAMPARLRAIEPSQTMSRPVVYSDIDFNRHVNTLRYIDLIFDMLPLETIENNGGMRLDINFLSEARYGETLTIGAVNEGSKWNFDITSEDRVLCRAQIELR